MRNVYALMGHNCSFVGIFGSLFDVKRLLFANAEEYGFDIRRFFSLQQERVLSMMQMLQSSFSPDSAANLASFPLNMEKRHSSFSSDEAERVFRVGGLDPANVIVFRSQGTEEILGVFTSVGEFFSMLRSHKEDYGFRSESLVWDDRNGLHEISRFLPGYEAVTYTVGWDYDHSRRWGVPDVDNYTLHDLCAGWELSLTRNIDAAQAMAEFLVNDGASIEQIQGFFDNLKRDAVTKAEELEKSAHLSLKDRLLRRLG